MEPRIDEMVLKVQQWLNITYGDDSRFNRVTEDGITGWGTIYGLRRALQIELGIQNTSNSFGPTTYEKCPNVNQGEEGNIVYIIQGGLWCKGYSPGGFNGYYGNGTYSAVKSLKADMGFPNASGNMNRDIMKALLDMSAFKCIKNGSEEIRSIQQQLNYDYYTYYQICPCDGLYNRDMNKMMIYALQKELGISKNSATGTWGPTTISLCKAKSYTIGNSSPIIKLVRFALVCNGYSISTSSSVFDQNLDTTLGAFASSLLLNRQSGTIKYGIIKSLLSSNGDTDRTAIGCDTASRLNQSKINTLKSNGYKIVGRYLTKVSGGLDKNMTNEEIKLILDNGLSIFPIFQEYGGGNSAFSKEKGIQNAKTAYQAAVNFGIPFGTTIYFAVDYDPQTAEINQYILPYFKGIYETLQNYSSRLSYKVGVYGTRNVCKILQDNQSNNLKIDSLFVSDASYGFSGNLGFPMPKNWAFDQFATDLTIGSGDGIISIDKVAVANINYGFNHVNNNVSLNAREKIYRSLDKLYKLALEHTNNNKKLSNKLVTQYIREIGGRYAGNMWNLTGGTLDKEFKTKADKIDQSHEYQFKDPLTNEDYDFKHLMATLNAILHTSEIPEIDLSLEYFDGLIDVFAGWGGDLTSFSKDLDNHDAEGKITGDLQTYANNLICKKQNSSRFSLNDYIADIDAVVMSYLLSDNIADLFYDYFIVNDGEISKHRSKMFVRNAYDNIDKFALAVNTFSEGLGVPEVIDVFTYLKEAILNNDEDLPESKYREAGAKALINFVTKECNLNR